MSKYNLGLIEIINPLIHGSCYYNNNWINSHYLTYESNIDIEDFYSDILNDDINYLNDLIKERIYSIERINNKDIEHPCIRNYKEIVSKFNYVNLEIIETKKINYLHDESIVQISISIKKTFWLKILQRKWKKYYKKKIQFLKNIKNLYYKEIHGKYPPFNVF